MKKHKKWSAAEDAVVLKEVKRSPQCLSKAFKKAGETLNTRTTNAIAARWYVVLSRESTNVCFITISGRHKCINRKIGNGIKSNVPVYKKVLKLLGLKY